MGERVARIRSWFCAPAAAAFHQISEADWCSPVVAPAGTSIARCWLKRIGLATVTRWLLPSRLAAQPGDVICIVVPGILIDDGDRGGKDQSSGAACHCRRSGRGFEDLVAEANPAVGQGLALRDAGTNEPYNLRGFGEFAVMETVAGLDLGEVDHPNLVGGQFLLVGRLFWID